MNNYKPSVTLTSYSLLGEINAFCANAYESLMNVHQSISRNTRLTSNEITKKEFSSRVYILSKASAYPGAAFQVIDLLKGKFKEIIPIDLEPLETKLRDTFGRSKHIQEAFKI